MNKEKLRIFLFFLLFCVLYCSGFVMADDKNTAIETHEIMRSARQRAMTATANAANKAQKATDECEKAKKNAYNAKIYAAKAEELLKELVGDADIVNTPLIHAEAARTKAENASTLCEKSMQAAINAENAAADALFKIMEYAKNMTKSYVLTPEQQQKIYEHAHDAMKEVEKAEEASKNAEIAARQTIEAANTALRAQETANEIAAVVNIVKQKMHEHSKKQLDNEKIKTNEAKQRARDAEMAVKLARDMLMNTELRQKENQVPTANTAHQVIIPNSNKDSVSYAVCGPVMLLLLMQVLAFLAAQ